MNDTNKLLQMYNSKFQPALPEGTYEVRMLSHEYVAHESSPYIKCTFEVLDTKRVLTENRFEGNFPIMVSHLRQQLGRENEEVQPIEFFNELIEKKTPFKIWVVKRVVNGRQRTNFNFLQPLATAPEAAPSAPSTEVSTDDMPF